jgi:hypothetical protein
MFVASGKTKIANPEQRGSVKKQPLGNAAKPAGMTMAWA